MSKDNLSRLNINIFDEIYVQTQGRVPFDIQNPPLAFATQTGVGFAKRKQTVDTWSGPEYRDVVKLDEAGNRVMRKDYPNAPEYVREKNPMTEGHTLANIPLEGFTFEKSVSRWSTSNKWFTINDPRGFQLQIAADNLGDILINAGVLNGALQGAYVWAKNGATIFLCRSSHPAYIDKIQPKVARTNLITGDIILMGQDTVEYEFLGTFYTTRLGTEYRYIEQSTDKIMPSDFRPPYQYSYYGNDRDKYKQAAGVTFSAQDDKLVHVFKNQYGLKLMRSKPTKIKIVRPGDPFCLKIGQPYQIRTNLPAGNVALFWDTIDEMKENGKPFIDSYEDTIRDSLGFGKCTSYQREPQLYGGDINHDLANNKLAT